MIVACGKSDPGPAEHASRERSTVEGNTAFATNLYGRLAEQPGNLCFSPYGISSVLAMAYAGARGQTEREIARTLQFNVGQGELHSAFRVLSATIRSAQRQAIKVDLANTLWCQTNQPLEDTYGRLIRAEYGAAPCFADFRDVSASAAEINTWFGERTNGRIKNLVNPGQIDPDTRLMLCSAVYFKGKWAVQFDRKATTPALFFVRPEQTVTVPMMRLSSKFKTAQAADLALLELPYTGKALSMILLLPSDYGGLPGLERRFTLDNLQAWLQTLEHEKEQKIGILLPRLKISQSFELSRTLEAMGMPSLFDKTDCDLSGMTARNDLFVSSVAHQATIEVNEEGTEAAAATAVHVRTKSQLSTFRADHPFLYLIKENRTGSILFLGRVVDPSKAQ